MTKMKLACTYKFSDIEGFISEDGATTVNSRIADEITRRGGTIRPIQIVGSHIRDYIFGDGSVASIVLKDHTYVIYDKESKFFERIAEGYPEPVGDDSAFVPITVTINNPTEARNAIRMLETLLK